MRKFLDWLWGLDSTNVALFVGWLSVAVLAGSRLLERLP